MPLLPIVTHSNWFTSLFQPVFDYMTLRKQEGVITCQHQGMHIWETLERDLIIMIRSRQKVVAHWNLCSNSNIKLFQMQAWKMPLFPQLCWSTKYSPYVLLYQIISICITMKVLLYATLSLQHDWKFVRCVIWNRGAGMQQLAGASCKPKGKAHCENTNKYWAILNNVVRRVL